MKTTEQRYLDRVTTFLHANLETNIGIDALSEVACLSSFHWHRIYTAMIAELAQYGSQDAFSRAFRDAYGKPTLFNHAEANISA
jgi:AraC family transcriptional regulator